VKYLQNPVHILQLVALLAISVAVSWIFSGVYSLLALVILVNVGIHPLISYWKRDEPEGEQASGKDGN
jgi:hypothetical protein